MPWGISSRPSLIARSRLHSIASFFVSKCFEALSAFGLFASQPPLFGLETICISFLITVGFRLWKTMRWPSDSATEHLRRCVPPVSYCPLGTLTSSVSTQKLSVRLLQPLHRGVMYISLPPKTFWTWPPTSGPVERQSVAPQRVAFFPVCFSQFSSHEDLLSPVDSPLRRCSCQYGRNQSLQRRSQASKHLRIWW